MVALSGELVVVLTGLATLAGYYLRRQEEPEDDDPGCYTHQFGPIKVLHTDTEMKADGGVDIFDIVLARCRTCGEEATYTYNIRHVEDPTEDWSEAAEPVEYDTIGRVTPPATGDRE